jgi:ribokinase
MFVVIGTATVDLLVSGLRHMPDFGGDEFTVDNLAFCDRPLNLVVGGNGANSAYVLARLGAPVTLCSAVGRDPLGDIMLNWLVEAGVDTGSVLRSQRAATSTTTVIMDESLNRVSFHHPGAYLDLTPAQVPAHIFASASALLVTSYPIFSAWRPDGFGWALALAHQRGALTALDVGPAIGRPATLAELQPLLPDVDYLIANAHELAVLTGSADLETGMAQVLEAGARCLVVKQGDRGAQVRRPTDAAAVTVAGFDVDTRFTVGAGDSFNGALLLGLQRGWDPLQAVQFANATAALVVSTARGVLGCPTLAEVESLLQTKRDIEVR